MSALLLAGTLALTLSASATQVSYTEGPCPLDAADVVRVYEKVSANTHGGYDSDGADYSTQGQFRTWAVATCARSLFSLYGGDMNLVLDPATAARLERALAEERARLPDPADPAVWERYGIAARMYRELGRGELFLADLYLEASWTARDEAVGVYVALRGPAEARQSLALGEAELAKGPPADKQKTLLYNLARIAHRGGFLAERDRYLDRFAAMAPHTPAEQAALDRFREAGQQVEPRYQDLAIAAYRQGLAIPDLDPHVRMQCTYLLADLLRRRGRRDEAVALFNQVLADDHTPRELREMALFLVRDLAG